MLEWEKTQLRGDIEEYKIEGKRWTVKWNPETGEGRLSYYSRTRNFNDTFSYTVGNFAEGVGVPKYVIDFIETLLISYERTQKGA